ncbi:MAG: UDP-4-amino-4,6-dideoxy-N-acetyl-beta-L-altrosamine N-acetyltransferase [Maribacter sp.]|nr:UDP-4-amino-4,6-dideoxy-N-acetyl-beta-L-altrosamine N-acetyltransferase [Maribacter sp.]
MEYYSRGNIKYVNFTSLEREDLLTILDWRNREEVRSMMRSNTIINEKTHFNFVEKLKQSDTSYYWLVTRKDRPCGVVYLQFELDQQRDKAEWGYYLSPSFIGTGVGLEVGFEAIHMFFQEFKLKELRGYVKKQNQQNLQLQHLFGFRQEERVSSDDLIGFVMFEGDYGNLENEFKSFRRKLIRNTK